MGARVYLTTLYEVHMHIGTFYGNSTTDIPKIMIKHANT